MADRKMKNSLNQGDSNHSKDNKILEADMEKESVREEGASAADDSCGIVQDLIPLYADGLACPASQKLIEEHVKNCADCASQLKEARHSLNVLPTEEDQKMESALKKVNRRFHRHWIMLAGLITLCAALLISGGVLFNRYIQVSADEISVEVTSLADQKTLKITSMFGRLFGVNTQDGADGEYEISAFRWREEKESEKTVILSDPVHSICFNQELVWQDGVTITPGCRQLYPYANGYAGSTQQMRIAWPDFPGMEYHITADTEDEDHCMWTYCPADGNTSKVPDQTMQQAWRKNALMVLALTPNLDKVRLAQSEDHILVEADRNELKKILDEAHLPDHIDSLRDLQLTMNAVLGPAG